MSDKPKIGVFLCNGGHLLSDRLNFNALKEIAQSHPQVAHVQEVGKLCTSEGAAALKSATEKLNLDVAVLGACEFTQSQLPLLDMLKQNGLEQELIETINLRELIYRSADERSVTQERAELTTRMVLEKVTRKDSLRMGEVKVSDRVVVVGHGWTALKAATELEAMGRPVSLVCNETKLGVKTEAAGYDSETAESLDALLSAIEKSGRIDKLLPSRIQDFQGAAGAYRVTVRDRDGVSREITAGGVILAPEPRLLADFQSWGLEPSKSCVSLSDFEALLSSQEYSKRLDALSSTGSARVVFLVGFTHTSSPVSQRRVFNAASKLAEQSEIQPIVILDNYKVAEPGLEALAYQARERGVLFIKVGDRPPSVSRNDQSTRISFFDDVMGDDITIDAHMIVLEERTAPRQYADSLIEKLGVSADPDGFFQADNIYNLPIFTGRTGVLAVGPGRGAVSLREGLAEAREAALNLSQLLTGGTRLAAEDRVKLDTKKCAICLTCYRLCPHRAISVVNRRPVFSDLACRACGLCASECPMDALQLHNYTDSQAEAELKVASPGLRDDSSTGFIPSIIAFCCKNSAVEAAQLASMRRMKSPLGLQIIEIPCAGKIDMDYVMSAFRDGADGVMALTCHPESCKSLKGSDLAQWRFEQLQEYIAEAGLEPERLVCAGLAPGMGYEFIQKVRQFEQELLELGESPIRKSFWRKKIA